MSATATTTPSPFRSHPPFGHGLTYATLAYDDLETTATGDRRWTVEATITNTGSHFAREVVQLYVSFDEPHPTRPRHERRSSTRIGLEPGASASVRFELTGRDLAWWSTSLGGRRIAPGPFHGRDRRLVPGHPPSDRTPPATAHSPTWKRCHLRRMARPPRRQAAPARSAHPRESPVARGPRGDLPDRPTGPRTCGWPKFTGFGVDVTPQDSDRLVAAVRSR